MSCESCKSRTESEGAASPVIANACLTVTPLLRRYHPFPTVTTTIGTFVGRTLGATSAFRNCDNC